MSLARVNQLSPLDSSVTIDVASIVQKNATVLTIPDYASLKISIPTSANQVVLVKGYNAGTRFGGGVFISVSGSATDDGGTVCVPTGSTSFYWQRADIKEVTPQMFGAMANGTFDDTTAMNKAMLSGYPIQMPAGKYRLTGPCGSATTTVGVSIRGAGDQTEIWYASTTAKINLVGDGARISNVWFRAKVAAVATYIDLGDINATIDSNGASVEDCLFGDEQTTFYATNYIRCYNLWYGTIHGNHFRGVGNGTATITAIHSYYSVNVSCTGNTFLFMGRCIRWNSAAAPAGGFFNEGWLIGDNAAAAIYTFFYANNGLAAHINNNIIDICFGPAIYSDAGTTRVTDNWIAAQDTNTFAYLVYLSGGFSVLHTNRLVGQTGIGVAIQIAGSSAEHIQVQDNNVFGCGTGASVSTAAPYLVFTGNTFLSQTLRAWDLTNASFLTYYGNTFRNSANATYPLSLLPTSGSNIIKKSWETTVTATLNAGTAGQDFTVSLPANLFSGTPLCQATLASGAYGLVVAYVYDSSNANTATMRIMNPSGAAIVNGTYRVCLKFTDQNY